jgi:hypothetical protein
MRRLLVLAVIGSIAAPFDAQARVRWSTPGSYRLRVAGLSAFDLDASGTDTGQRVRGRHRLRIDPTIELGPVTVYLQIDVLTGQVFGDVNPVGARFVERRHGEPDDRYDGWTTVEPRQAWLELDTRYLRVEAGQMASGWGMGLLAGDGEDDAATERNRWVERFGDRWSGDLVQRLTVATRPLAFFQHGKASDVLVGVGIDQVYQDDQASLLDDDSALELLGFVVYPGEEVTAGAHVVHRRQDDRDGDSLVSTAIDLHGRWTLPLYMVGADLRLMAEGVLVLGETDRLRPAGSPEGVDLLQLGWAARGEMSWRCPRVALGVEVGYASGDADPDDGDHKAFTFDPDHRVGFVLFQDVLRLITLRGAERLADPAQVGVVPAGAEQLPTDGAVRNAWYVFPGVTWRPGPWQLTAAAMAAWAAQPFLDPAATYEAGGLARNHRGRPAQRFYGAEALGAAHYGLELPGVGQASAGLQAGLFLPGGALDPDFTDAPIYKVLGRLDLRW